MYAHAHVQTDTHRPWTMHSSSIVWPRRAWYVLLLPVGVIMCGLRFRSNELAGQREAEMHREGDRLIHMDG